MNDIYIGNGVRIICTKGLHLKVLNDCFDEGYLHEVTRHYRSGLKEKTLKAGDIVKVEEHWSNFYGSYIRCLFNGEIFDVDPHNLTLII